jgi:hypothetical protein
MRWGKSKEKMGGVGRGGPTKWKEKGLGDDGVRDEERGKVKNKKR